MVRPSPADLSLLLRHIWAFLEEAKSYYYFFEWVLQQQQSNGPLQLPVHPVLPRHFSLFVALSEMLGELS
jgi:hypothetical protein